MHFLKSNKTITKPVLFLALLLSLSTIIGCNSKVATDAGSTEADQSQETEIGNEVSANDLSGNTVSPNTISENTVSENAISENTVKELAFNEEQVNINDYLKDERLINYFNNKATSEQREIIQLGFSRFIKNMDSESGIYCSKFDFETAYGGKYKDVNQVEFQKYYNIGYAWGLSETIIEPSGVAYIGIMSSGVMNDIRSHQPCFAPLDSLSIISLNDDELNRYYIIKDYQGEDVIEANTYISMVTNRLIDFELSDFSVTPVRDYLNRKGLDSGFYTHLFSQFNESEYYNKSK